LRSKRKRGKLVRVERKFLIFRKEVIVLEGGWGHRSTKERGKRKKPQTTPHQNKRKKNRPTKKNKELQSLA